MLSSVSGTRPSNTEVPTKISRAMDACSIGRHAVSVIVTEFPRLGKLQMSTAMRLDGGWTEAGCAMVLREADTLPTPSRSSRAA
jgi:hypothetical protein